MLKPYPQITQIDLQKRAGLKDWVRSSLKALYFVLRTLVEFSSGNLKQRTKFKDQSTSNSDRYGRTMPFLIFRCHAS